MIPISARRIWECRVNADLEKAAEHSVVSAFANSGRVCVSLQRIYVNAACVETFSSIFVEKVQQLQIGDPLETTCDIGPLIDAKEVERIDSRVREAVQQGALNTAATIPDV